MGARVTRSPDVWSSTEHRFGGDGSRLRSPWTCLPAAIVTDTGPVMRTGRCWRGMVSQADRKRPWGREAPPTALMIAILVVEPTHALPDLALCHRRDLIRHQLPLEPIAPGQRHSVRGAAFVSNAWLAHAPEGAKSCGGAALSAVWCWRSA
jgi:hypothetical protein